MRVSLTLVDHQNLVACQRSKDGLVPLTPRIEPSNPAYFRPTPANVCSIVPLSAQAAMPVDAVSTVLRSPRNTF